VRDLALISLQLDRNGFLLSLADMELWYLLMNRLRCLRVRAVVIVCCLCLALGSLTAGLAGCSRSRESEMREASLTGIYAAQTPAFLIGAASVLLTNGGGYSAHLTAQSESFAAQNGVRSGQVLCRGSKLLFAPAPGEAKSKKTRSGDFAFIWDVATGSGFVLSGALQGYAPVSTSVKPTNVVSQGKALSQKVDGHASMAENATVQMNDGSSATFEVFRTVDLAGFPIRISTVTNPMPLTLSLSKVRFEPPAEEVFMPPDDFTKYSSPEVMADEVAARQRNLHRKASSPPIETFGPLRPQH